MPLSSFHQIMPLSFFRMDKYNTFLEKTSRRRERRRGDRDDDERW
jgi:hypothetical protein